MKRKALALTGLGVLLSLSLPLSAFASTLYGQYQNSSLSAQSGTNTNVWQNLGTGFSGTVKSITWKEDIKTIAWAGGAFEATQMAQIFEYSDPNYATSTGYSCQFTQSGASPSDPHSDGQEHDAITYTATDSGGCTLSPSKYYRLSINNCGQSGFTDWTKLYGVSGQVCSPQYPQLTDSNGTSLTPVVSAFTELDDGLSYSSGFGCADTIPSTTISSNIEWAAGIHRISGIVTISSGATLTIHNNAIIKFDTATTSGIVVDGTLEVNGDPSTDAPVFFTSLKDDLIGGDTNGDGNSTTPAAGDWSGITINSD